MKDWQLFETEAGLVGVRLKQPEAEPLVVGDLGGKIENFESEAAQGPSLSFHAVLRSMMEVAPGERDALIVIDVQLGFDDLAWGTRRR